ncbi:MAG TPA: ornithine carbamoyltransferase, partial [Acidimicrobiia bacterium]|nr:ornithine carbamoyltransferase [Acidimicrobiia bacterium]
ASDLAEILERSKSDSLNEVLSKKTAALLFQKPSLRTRHSLEAAIAALGGHPVYTRPEEVGIDERETAEDIARSLSQYHAIIAARVFEHSILERMASVSNVPIINLLSNSSHPVQTLADLLTIKQEFGSIENKNIVYIGDANNVSYSLAFGTVMSGASFTISHPKDFPFSVEQIEKFKSNNIDFNFIENPSEAVKQADVIYTDAWYSMGQEDEASIRQAAFTPYQVNQELLDCAPEHAIFLHCLPAHRGQEVTSEVLDGSQSRIWAQAQNRMHSMRGLISFLLDS